MLKRQTTKISEEDATQFAYERRKRIALLEVDVPFIPDMQLIEFFVEREKEMIPCSLYRPIKENVASYPTIFYVPGTAFTGRSDKLNDMNGKLLAHHSGCQVFLINHRLAPENKFPTALDDVEYIILDILRNQTKYRIDSNKLIFAGYSSGATLIVETCIKYNESKTYAQPILQVLISPVLDFMRTPNEFEHLEQQDEKVSELFIAYSCTAYVQNTALDDPKLSPLYEDDLNIQKLPTTLLIHAEFDRLRGDAERFAQRLAMNKVPFAKHVIPKANHAFFWFDPGTVKQVGEKIGEIIQIPSPTPIL